MTEETEKKSWWKGFAFFVAFLVAFAIAVIVYVVKQRSAAKLLHERNVLIEEKNQKDLKLQKEKETVKAKKLIDEIVKIENRIDTLDAKIEKVREAKAAVLRGLKEVESWEDLKIS